MDIRDYGQDQELIKQFLRDYTYVNENGDVVSKYGEQMTKIANREDILLPVELADLEKFNTEISRQVEINTSRYTQLFYNALDEILPLYKTKDPQFKDIMDVFIEQRLSVAERLQRNQGAHQGAANATSQATNPNGRNFVDIDGSYPPDLIRRVEVAFKPTSFKPIPVREVKAEHVGKYVTVRGIVTRSSQVKPKITIVTYTCDHCGYETFQPVKGSEFTPLFECSSAACKNNKIKGRMTMQTRGSKFVKFEEIKLQEHSDQVPTGHIPRTITIHAYGEMTRLCVPGDHISVSGVFLPVEKAGYRLRTGGLTADTYLEAHWIAQMNKTEDDELSIEPLSDEEAAELISGGQSFLTRLSNSIAPEIFGHENLKKALLLLLVGGVDRNQKGMKIRGNINICLMGDPGVAKSQLLGFIDRLAPRSQYTTGRGSSGVGLTAAVLKDPITNELCLEGGALVLADGGICCIDEFDKMMDADRTAIHEVMEQQTVSIAKAGIMTTLNARVSILAAANPAYGRYNVHKTITDNLDLPPALLSRFDLLWLIRDMPERENDLSLAQHVTHVHSHPNEPIVTNSETIDMKVMRRYITLCKTKHPIVPKELDPILTKIYLDIRSRKRAGVTEDSLFTSARSLLAIIRLSTAFARLRLAEVVEKADVEAAYDLFNCSRESIEGAVDATASCCLEICDLIRTLSESDERTLSVKKVVQEAESRGFKTNDIWAALDRLTHLETIELDGDQILYLGR